MSSRSKSSGSSSLKVSSNGKNHSNMASSIITIIYNLLIVSYIMQLEDAKCGCITDWRHDFIKYYSIALVIWAIITIGFDLGTNKNQFVNLLKNILMFAALINIWCLYTYVGDLDKTKCMCAIDKQKKMHSFLYLWRYVLVGVIILSLVGIIFVNLGFTTSSKVLV